MTIRTSAAAFAMVSMTFFSMTGAQGDVAATHAHRRVPLANMIDRGHGMSPQAISASSLTWHWANPTPNGDAFTSVAFGGGTYVVVGDDGVIYDSSDGSHWTAEDSGLPIGSSLFDVIYAGGQFVAGGSSFSTAFILTSPDGVTWTQQEQQPLADGATHLAYGNGTYVAVNVGALTSSDGKTWTQHTIGSINSLSKVSFAAPVFDGSVFVTLGVDANFNPLLYYSADNGATWQQATITVAAGNVLLHIGWNGTEFTAIGDDNACPTTTTCGLVYTSNDGKTWTQQADAGGVVGFGDVLAVNGSRFYSISSDSTGSSTLVYTSTDGSTWTSGATVSTDFPEDFTGHGVVAVGTLFVGIRNISATPLLALSSPDFANWSGSSLASGNSGDLGNVVSVNNKFFAMDQISGLMESSDGASWTSVSTSGPFDDIAWNGTTYVAAASPVQTSQDGVHWTPTSPGLSSAISVAYGNGLFVAVGGGGAVATSPDGKTWTTRSSGTSNELIGVVWMGSRFVAVNGYQTQTNGTSIITSTDGVTWSTVTSVIPPSGNTYMFSHLRWTGSELLAAGGQWAIAAGGVVRTSTPDSPVLATSSDGLNWTVLTYGAGSPFAQFSRLADAAVVEGALFVTDGFNLAGSRDNGQTLTMLDNAPTVAAFDGLAVNGATLVGVGVQDIVYGSGAPLPTATAGSLTATTGVSASGTLSGTSGVKGDALTYAVVTQPAHGSVTVTSATAGTYSYTSTAGYTGADSFTFAVTDSQTSGQSTPATIAVTVNAAASGGSGGGKSGGGTQGLPVLALIATVFVLRRRRAVTLKRMA